jgi:hypothetical protein
VSLALADEPATTNAARATLVELVSEVPGRRDHALPTTPASPVPIGPGPAAAGAATTDPVPTVPNVGPVAPPMLTLSQQRIELATGDSVELIVELDADDGSGDVATIQWQSSDPAVVAVSPDGYVTAVGPGLAEVACTWRGKRAVCVVQVSPAATTAQPAEQAAAPPPDRHTEIVAPEPVAKPPAPRPVVIARETPDTPLAAPPAARPQRRWWIGVLAAGLVVAAVVRGVRSGSSPVSVGEDAPPAAGSPTTTSVAPAVQAPSPPAPAAPAVPPATTPIATPTPKPELVQKSAAPNAGPPRGSAPAAAGAAAGAATATNKPATPPSVPIVPPPRTDSVRLTTSRIDSSGYGASRPAASTPTPAASTTAAAPPPTAPAARDSSAERIPPASREVAAALFKDFASSINSRTYSRITAAYSQPNDAAAVTVWRDFLVFVRDYTPRAVVRSTTVDASTNPPTITANIDFRWSTDAGFDRVRGASFTGIGVPVSGGWQLVRVQLAKKFW